MKLTKKQREALKQKFGGFCAYCGDPLQDRWHADHVVAIKRNGSWHRQPKDRYPYYELVWVQDGTARKPHQDTLENMHPTCIPCNMSKGDQSLEVWRKKLEAGAEAARRDCPIYKHAVRFGLIVETPKPIEFHFERWQRTPRRQLKEDTP